jgi:hypothetical protein
MTAAVIINYCSNERNFIGPLLTQCSLFSKDIIVSYGSHFYDGKEEDQQHFKSLIQEYPDVKFVSYQVDLNETERPGVEKRATAYWHNLARWTAINALSETSPPWVFVIDADEIPEGTLVKTWLDNIADDLNPECCYKMACYWYFKLPENQATTLEDSILLIHKRHLLIKDNIFGDNERDHLIKHSKSRLLRTVKDLNGSVMWHHYSFVRSKEGLIRKLSTWAHVNDLFKNVDPTKFVEFIFQDDKVNDIVHRYEYKKVANKFNLKCS